MEVALLTARLDAQIAGFMANMAAADTQIAATRRELAGLERDALAAKVAINSLGISPGQAAQSVAAAEPIKRAAQDIRDSFVGAAAAAKDVGVSPAKTAEIEAAATAVGHLRDNYIEADLASKGFSRGGGVSRVVTGGGGVYGGQYIPSAGDRRGFPFFNSGGGMSPEQAARDYLRRNGGGGDGIIRDVERATSGGGGGAGGGGGGGFLAGLLPGGRRAGAGAVTTAIGLGVAALPGAAPGLAGLAVAAPTGIETLLGGAGTLKLAFADLTAAAFTTQKAFDALTPVQKQFVQNLRELDAGFVRPLERLAQSTVLPKLTSAIQSALTPAAVGNLRAGVSAFGGAIGGGAQQLGTLFGSNQFQASFGQVLQANARYLRDFIGGLSNLFDALIHLQQAAIPFTDWLDKGLLRFSQWTDASIKAAQKSGELAHFFDMAKQSLQVLGGLLGSVGNLAKGVFDAVGFQNSLNVIRLISDLINTLAGILEKNQVAFRNFFAGAVQSAKDLLSVIQFILPLLDGLISTLDAGARAIGGWRVAIDALAILWAATMARNLGWVKLVVGAIVLLADQIKFLRPYIGAIAVAAGLFYAAWKFNLIQQGFSLVVKGLVLVASEEAAVGAAAVTAAGEVGGLRGALLALGGSEVLAALAPVLSVLGALALPVGVTAFALWKSQQKGATGGVPVTPQTFANSPGAAAFAGHLGGGSFANNLGGNVFSNTSAFGPDGTRRRAAPVSGSGISDASSGGGYGAQFSLTLPPEIQNQLAAAQAGHGNMQRANQAAYAYYEQILKNPSLTQAQKTSIFQAEAPYAPSPYGTPKPLQGAGSAGTVLTPRLEQAIAAAQAGGIPKNEVAQYTRAINYLNDHMAGFTATQKTTAEKLIATYEKDIAAVNKHVQVLQQQTFRADVQQHALTVSQAMAAFVSGTGPGTTPGQQKQAAEQLVKIATTQQKQLEALLKTATNDQERTQIAREMLLLTKDIAKARTAERQAVVSGQIDKLLGLGPTVQPGAQSVATRIRSTLIQEINRFAPQAKGETAAQAGRALIPNETTVSLQRLIKEMQQAGVEFPKQTLKALEKLITVVDKLRSEGGKLTSAQTEKVSAYLSEINTTLDGLAKGTSSSNYHVPTEKELVAQAGLSGLSAQQRKQAGAFLAEVAELKGKIPNGPTAFGIPVGGSANAAPRSGALGPKLVSEHGRGGGYTVIEKVEINVNGATKSPHQIATEVRNEILKGARRNPTQTRGPAGWEKPRPKLAVSKIAKFDASGADAYAVITVPAEPEYRLSFSYRVPSATILVLQIADLGETGVFVDITDSFDNAGIAAIGSAWDFHLYTVFDTGVLVPQDTWFTVTADLTYVSGTLWDINWKVDGSPIGTESGVDLNQDSSAPMAFDFGSRWNPGNPDGNIYYGATFEIKNGSGDTLFFDDFSSGGFSSWDSTVGSATVIDDPFGPAGPSIGIRAAFGYAAFDTAAVFTRLDEPTVPPLTFVGAANNVVGYQIDRGRTYELDKTQAGTASLTLLDTSGIFDPTNPASPLYGLIGPMVQTKCGVQNPHDGSYTDLFSGFLESWAWTETTDEKLMTVQIGLVDGFEPLTRCEIPPDANGGSYTSANGTTTFLATSDVQTRIDALLGIAGWPNLTPAWRNINTGNVKLQQTVYNVQTSVLAAIQDAADAEFPGVANFFMTKNGAARFLGRYPRFDPALFPQDVAFWTVGDKNAALTFANCAQIKEIEWDLDQKNLINNALCFPYGIAQADIPGQLVSDGTSTAEFGVRTLSLPDLINDNQVMNSLQPALTRNQVAKAYGQYYVDNYARPQMRISKLTFEVVLGSAASASVTTWAFVLGVEISDILTVYTSNAGGGGFGKGTGSPESPTPAQFFVEGIHYTAAFQDDTPVLTLSLDVSPRGWFSFAPWAN